MPNTTSRTELHEQARIKVRELLEAQGHQVIVKPPRVGYDFTVNGVRIAVKGATCRMLHHRVVVAGKTYEYDYPQWLFNLHRHGLLDIRNRYADFICCVTLEENGKGDVFVIPWKAITGKTFSFHVSKRRKGYRGQYAPYRNKLRNIAKAVARKV